MAPQNGLSKIEHIVVLMLENRSLDNLLGFLYTDQGNVSPLGHAYEGLTGNESNPDGNGNEVKVFRIQAGDEYSYFMPMADPGEGFNNTNSQLFGTTSPKPGAQATNQGFVTNFAYTLTWESKEANRVLPGTTPSDIMGMFTPEMLPVLSTLAKSYAVCDQWYASAPTETIPNRAFAAMATSQGQLTDDTKTYTAPSIFMLLENNGQTWSVYGYNAPPLTQNTVADITHASSDHFGEFDDFKSAASGGNLANFVFLEPEWGSHGNSQHPNYDVALGEQMILDVYRALRDSPAWEQTLFIITYDEHGGCYDHVVPPTNAVPPDNSVGQYGFDFTRFGLRVPTVLVSPWIEAGTVYRVPDDGTVEHTPFDHTSVLATVEKRFGLKNLTARDKAAPDVGGVLTLETARTDDPLEGVTAPTSNEGNVHTDEPSHLENVLAQSVASLPVTDEQGHKNDHKPVQFKTGKEAIKFARKRYNQYHSSRQGAKA